jgi:hypothetical protein
MNSTLTPPLTTSPQTAAPTALPGSRPRDERRGRYGGGMQGRAWAILGAAVVLVLALIGVGVWREVSREVGHGPNVFILASGSLNPGHMTYRYTTFSGLAREKTDLAAGQTIHLSFASHVTKGSLSFELKDPVGASVWRVNVPQQQDRSGTASIPAARSGAYQVVVTGLDTGGSFDVSWSAR